MKKGLTMGLLVCAVLMTACGKGRQTVEVDKLPKTSEACSRVCIHETDSVGFFEGKTCWCHNFKGFRGRTYLEVVERKKLKLSPPVFAADSGCVVSTTSAVRMDRSNGFIFGRRH